MITLKNFTKEIRKYNKVEYLKNLIEKVNSGEGYLSLKGKHVILNKYLTGHAKNSKNKFIENNTKNIVSFEL